MGESVRFSESDRRNHRSFWQANDRIGKLREAFTTIRDELGTTDADLRHRIDLILGGGDTPVPRTVGRFSRGADLNNKPWAVTALCWAMAKLCDELPNRVSTTPEAVATLRTLLKEAQRQFPTFPPPAAAGTNWGPVLNRRSLEVSLKSIRDVEGEDNPKFPEFPPHSPRYPAHELIPLDIADCEVLLKDESLNPTGSHKDRWAWEQLQSYRRVIQLHLDHGGTRSKISIPSLAIISAGSAAYALQTLLRLYSLPPLHVILDEERVTTKVSDLLRGIGAIIHPYDLDTKFLEEDDVRSITGLGNGCIDLTTRRILTPNGERFYDWLVCEIIKEKPTFIFVPFGTGDLYSNIICFIEKELGSKIRDARITKVKHDELIGINVVGATTHDSHTRMNKLYAKERPTWDEIQDKVKSMKIVGSIGPHSGVFDVSDEDADVACDLANVYNIQTELSGIAGLGLFMSMKNDLNLNANSDKVVIVNTGRLFLGH